MLNEAGWPLLKWDAEKHPRDARGRFSLAAFSPRKTIARLSVLSRHNRLTADYGYSRTKELPDSVLDYSIDSTAISDYLYANKGKLPLSGRGSKSKQRRLISDLDATIKAHKTKRDISVFTGVATDIGALKPGKDGNIYTRNYAYTSTSIDPSVARSFARVSGPTGGYVNIVKIKVPSGFSGIYLGDAANAASERELLLPRGLRLKINPTPTVFGLKDFSHGRRKSYVWDAEIVSGLRKVDDEVELEAPILDSELLKWDESKHPRGTGGKFTQSQRRLLRMGVPRRVLEGAAGRVKLVTPEMVGVEARGRFGATPGLAGLFSPGKSVSLRGAAQRAGNPGPRLANAAFGAPTANMAGLFERVRRSPSYKGTGTVLVGGRVYGAPLSSSEHPLTNTTRASRRAVALHEALHSVDLASGKKSTLSSHPDFVRAFLSERYEASTRNLYGASNRVEAFAEAARAIMTPRYNPSSAAVKEKVLSGKKISVAERKNPGLSVDLDPSSKIRTFMPKTVRVARRLLLAARYLKKGLRKASFLDVERAAAQTNVNPTPAQSAAGNYKKGTVRLHGLTIRIENPAGSVRRGTDRNGKEWSATMPAHYGYISGTKGMDGDEVDVWIGPVPDLAHVYIINQLRLGTEKFDEHKIGMGFHHESDFLSVYRMAYPNLNADDMIHDVVRMPVWRLKRWLASGRPAKQMAKMAEVSSGRYLKSRLAAMYCKAHGRDLALFGPYVGIDGRRRVVVQDKETKRKWSVAYAKVKLEALTGKPLESGFEADHKNNDRTNDAARNLVALNSYENKVKSGKYRRSLAKAKQQLTAEDVATLSEGRIARMIERTMSWVRGDVIDDIIAGLRAGASPAEVAREVAAGEGLKEKLHGAADALEEVYARAGQESRDGNKKLIAFQFDARNPKSATYFDEYRLWLVREMSAEQEATIQTIAREGILSGKSLDAVARDLRVTVGLTAYQARNVMNYRRELEDLEPAAMLRALRDRRYDSTIRRAIESGDALTPEQITKMVEAYHRRYVAYRSVTIARTEGLRAANMGVMASAYQAIDDGVVRPQDVVKRWIAKIDDKTRDSHAELNGQQIRGVDSPFRASSGALLAFPGDPSAPAAETIACRCSLAFTFLPPNS